MNKPDWFDDIVWFVSTIGIFVVSTLILTE